MVHAEGAEKHIDVIVGVGAVTFQSAAVLTGAHELQLAVGRRRAHLEVLTVAEALEQLSQPARLFGGRDHVQVGVVTRAELEGVAVLTHAQAAEQAQRKALGAGRVDQPTGLVGHVVTNAFRGRCLG